MIDYELLAANQAVGDWEGTDPRERTEALGVDVDGIMRWTREDAERGIEGIGAGGADVVAIELPLLRAALSAAIHRGILLGISVERGRR